MIDKFLRAKHWQIFLWTVGIPFVGFLFFYFLIIVAVAADPDNPNEVLGISSAAVLILMILISTIASGGWIWSIGEGTHKYVPDELKLNPTQFKVSFFIPIVFVALLFLGLLILIFYIASNGLQDDMREDFVFGLATVMPFVFMLGFTTFLSVVYCLYHAAKNVKLAEKKQPVTFGEFVGIFFMIWFTYIGVWLLQPKLNALYEAHSRTPDPDLPEA